MQITSGLISVTNGSTTVTGNDSVDWTQVTVYSLLIVLGQTYDIVSVDAGTKTILISPAYQGATDTDIAYAIVRDFTKNHGLPLLNPGDLEAAALFSRAMQRLDSLLSSGGGDVSLGEIVITKTGHGFIIGNFLTISGGVWVLATSNTMAMATIVGVVKEVVDANQVKIVTQGRIDNVAGITMSAGTIYYLRNSTVAGGGGNVNLTDNLSYVGIQVPVLMADGPSSGWILNLARAQSGVFSQDVSGLVPGPLAGDVSGLKFLRADGTWQSVSVGAQSINNQHLTQGGSVDWTNFLAGNGSLSVLTHLGDLNSRVAALAAYARTTHVVKARRTKVFPGSGEDSFTVGARVTSIRVKAYAGSRASYQYYGPRTDGFRGNILWADIAPSFGIEVLIPVAEGDVISWNIAQRYGVIDEPSLPKADQGRIRLYKNSILMVDLIPVGFTVGTEVPYAQSLYSLDPSVTFLSFVSWDLFTVMSLYEFNYTADKKRILLDDASELDFGDGITTIGLVSNSGVLAGSAIGPNRQCPAIDSIAGVALITYED